MSVAPATGSATFDEDQRKPLERLFKLTLGYLAGILIISLGYAATQVNSDRPELFLLCVAAGVAGSATAALVSTLERHAQGLEDNKRGATPDPTTRKERFSERMFYWFIMRPWLGGAVAAAVFWGFVARDSSPGAQGLPTTRVAFYGMLAGLFAKSVLDILRALPKNVFKQ